MNDYLVILIVRPLEGGKYWLKFENARLRLYARAESEQRAAEMLLAKFDRQDLQIESVVQSGVYDIQNSVYQDKIEKYLRLYGTCAHFELQEPSADIGFSKN